MPESFPRYDGDFSGIFSVDYIAAIEPYCDVTVLMRGHGDHRGLARSSDGSGIEYITWTPSFRNGPEFWQRLGRLESLYGLGRVEPFIPKVDLIHAHGPVFHGVPALTLRRKRRIPLILTVHTNPFSKLLRRTSVRLLTRRTLERVDCVCPVSNDLHDQIEHAGIRPRRVEVTYNPVDTGLFRLQASDKLHRRIVFAGRLEEYKGGLRVLRAFAEIAEHWPGWRLAIAGDGPERPAIEEFLRTRPALAGRVELPGTYTKPQLAELFATSDCFVCPSRHETFGLVLAEAMSAGLPVIGPNCTAPPEFIDARCGLLVPPDDVSAIARAMEQLLSGLGSYRREVIRQSAVERFGFAAFGKRLLTLYNDLCTGSGESTCAESQA